MENEEWRDIPGYNGMYQVSNFGRVKSLERVCAGWYTARERILKPGNHIGYPYINLCDNGKSRSIFIHKLVALLFIDNPLNKKEVDHIDGNRKNNRVNNLRWATRKENQNNPVTKGRQSKYMTGRFGKLHNKSKPIICIESGVMYWGTGEASRMTGISNSHISSVCNGSRKNAGGFHWRFATEEEITTN